MQVPLSGASCSREAVPPSRPRLFRVYPTGLARDGGLMVRAYGHELRSVPPALLPVVDLWAFGAARASSTCYGDEGYPAIASAAPIPSGYRIVLSGTARGRSDTAPALEFSSGWKAAGLRCAVPEAAAHREPERRRHGVVELFAAEADSEEVESEIAEGIP